MVPKQRRRRGDTHSKLLDYVARQIIKSYTPLKNAGIKKLGAHTHIYLFCNLAPSSTLA